MRDFVRRRDSWAGLLLLVVGLGAVLEGQSLSIGSLTDMGPGYFPTVLGVILACVGLAIAATASTVETAETASAEVVIALHDRIDPPDWRGIAAIVAGVVAFLVLGRYAGLIPATFACILVSALGDRVMSLRAALLLATIMTAVAVGLFHYGLQVQFPLLGMSR
jgi:hypothetical protein